MLNKENSRVIAHKAICLVALEKQALSDALFPDESTETPFAKSLVYGSIRFYHHLNDIITPLIKKPLEKKNLDIHSLIVLGAYQLLYTNISSHAAINETVQIAEKIGKPWAKGFINAILRGIDRDKDSILKVAHHSHPSWLLKKIKKDYPLDYQEIFFENNKKAPMSIRVHPSIDLGTFKDKLKKQNIFSETSNIALQALILDDAVKVSSLPDFEKGSCYVQDVSAQLAAQLVSPKEGELILDACCAPGGKTTHIAELCPDANIVALDNDEIRLLRVKENIDRLKTSNVQIILGDATSQDWWDQKQFDKILIDAPCSGTGVIRRHPDIKLLRKPKDVSQITKIQALILDNLWHLLKPGGELIYATCSILPDENERQIISFIERFEDATNEQISLSWGSGSIGKQQLPKKIYDGFYYAKLTKKL